MDEEELKKLLEELDARELERIGVLQHTEEGFPFYAPSETAPKEAPATPDAWTWEAPTETSYDVAPPQPVPETPKEKVPEVKAAVPLLDVIPPELMPEPAEEEPGAFRRALEPERQFGSWFLEETARTPWSLMSLLAQVPTPRFGATARTDEEIAQAAEWLERQGKGAAAAIRKVTGRTEPETPLEKLGAYTGAAFTPAGKFTVPLTTGLATTRALTGLEPEDVPAMPKELADLLLTPAEAADSFGEALEKKGRGRKTTLETLGERRLQELVPESVVKKPRKGRVDPTQLTPTAEAVVQTVGGNKLVPAADLWGAGVLAMTTAGMIAAPFIGAKFRFNRVPRPRSVKEAAPGTVAISIAPDLARIYDDASKGAFNVARRAGVAPDAIARLEDTFRIQTRAGARHLVESAITEGRMETPTFSFRSPIALDRFRREVTPEAQQYLLLRDTFDELNLMSQQRKFLPSTATPAPGPPTVAGMTMPDVLVQMNALERANPEVVSISKLYNQHIKAVRNYESTGEYATREAKNANWKNPAAENRSVGFLNASRPNEVPFLGERSRGMSLADRGNPIEAQIIETKNALRIRMENEAIGQFIDESRRAMPGLFTRVTREQLETNPEWKKNTIMFYRRGRQEYYTSDPFLVDSMKMDPYFITNGAGQAVFAAKRMLEFGATGMGAPMFAPISMLRNWQIGKYTAEKGFRSPTLIGSMKAIGDQLYPQIARSIALTLDTGSGGRLTQYMNQAWVQGLSRRLAKVYDDSLYAQLKITGTSRGSILEQQMANTALAKASVMFDRYGGPAKPFWNAWKSTLESIHNGPAFNYVQRNLGVRPLPVLASRARALTGDPRVGGQYFVRGPAGSFYSPGQEVSRPFRFQAEGARQRAGAALARTYGFTTEIGRDAIPWFNATQQGIKRIGEAYLRDPVGFTRNTWVYAMAPAAALYYYTRALGKDPNGVDYTDYALNRRSQYARQMNWYVPIPGRPAEDGVEIPFFHELAPAKRLMEVALDHAFGTAQNEYAQDYWNAAHALMDTAITPPFPPAITSVAGLYGIRMPQGPFAGEAYMVKEDPFNAHAGMPGSIEGFTRALAGGLSQTLGAGYAAFTHTPDGFFTALKNAGEEMGRTQIQRAPILRDITGILPPVSGNTDVSKELFSKQKSIAQLVKYFQQWDKSGGLIETKGASKGGEVVAERLLGPPLPQEAAGLNQPEPTNPLYKMFAADLYNRFKKETPNPVKGEDEGGIGFNSLWRRYGDATAQLKRLSNIDAGNYTTWQKELDTKPGVKGELEAANVDTTNLREVRNYFIKKRQDAARVILYTIKAVEHDFSQRAGKPVRIEDLDPYKGTKPEETPAVTELPF